MHRLQIEVALTALAVILSLAIAGTWFEPFLAMVQTADFGQASYVALCVLASAANAGIAAGLQRKLPYGVGVPVGWSLAKYLGPTVPAVVTSAILIAWTSFLISVLPESSPGPMLFVAVARWLDIGILIICTWLMVARAVDFRRARILRKQGLSK